MVTVRSLRSLVPMSAIAVALVFVASGSAAWGGSDPAHNTKFGLMPSSCRTDPTGKECIDATVYYLDKARARSGLGPYALPADFASLSPTKQMFILVNLDRIAYHLPPYPGLSSALNRDALATGVWVADDPHPTHTTGLTEWWPGWAGAFPNAPMAYETWVWNDGMGSTNPRCVPADRSRCWGHRHSVLWRFASGSRIAMGAAAGRDLTHHSLGYAYLFVGGNSAFHPTWTYTWKQAVADGAGTNVYDYGPPPGAKCNVPVAIGLGVSGASKAIEKAHCKVGAVIQQHSGYVPGVVFKQHPAPGKTLARGSSVRLTVSLGPS